MRSFPSFATQAERLMNARTCLLLGTLLAGLAVAAGTFGAHVLPDFLNDRYGISTVDTPADFAKAEKNFETGARYQMYHALGLLLIGLLLDRGDSRALRIAGASFAFGIVIFSGCLYALVLLQQRWLGAIVPIGGTAFLIGWIALAVGVMSRTPSSLATSAE